MFGSYAFSQHELRKLREMLNYFSNISVPPDGFRNVNAGFIPATWVKVQDDIAKGAKGEGAVLKDDLETPVPGHIIPVHFIGPADTLKKDAVILARWTEFNFSTADGGMWAIQTAHSGEAGDGAAISNECICALIELLHCKDHLSDITEQEWQELAEKCNCGGTPPDIIGGCFYCKEQEGQASAVYSEYKLTVNGVVAVPNTHDDPWPEDVWDQIADWMNGEHIFTIQGDDCSPIVYREDFDKPPNNPPEFENPFIRGQMRTTWQPDGWISLSIGGIIQYLYYGGNISNQSDGSWSFEDPPNGEFADVDCLIPRSGTYTQTNAPHPEVGGLDFSNATFSWEPSGGPALPPCENEKQPANSTVHYIGELPAVVTAQQSTRALKNQMATEGVYLGVANKATDDDLAPKPIGNDYWVRDLAGTWPDPPPLQPITANVIFCGHRYQQTGAEAYSKLATGLWIPASMVGFDVEVWAVNHPLELPEYQVIVPNFTIAADDVEKWIEIPRGYNLIPPGQITDIIARYGSKTGPVSFAYDWNYLWSNGDPASGVIHQQNGDRSDLRVHQEDYSGVDRSSELDLIVAGSTIDVIGMTWEVINASKVGAVYYFEVAPATRGVEGIQSVTFTYYGQVPKDYVQVPNYYASYPFVSGIFGTVYDPDAVVTDDHGYGVDIRIQEFDLSEDWDILSSQ